jgi:hypothetical protein
MRNHLLTNVLFLSLLTITGLAAGNRVMAQSPVPANEQQFQVPLSDGTTGTGMFCWMPDGSGVFVASSPSGKIILLKFQKPSPTPTPEPPTPPQPVTQKLTIGIVEDVRATTIAEKEVMIDKEWRDLTVKYHTFVGIIPHNLKELSPAPVKPLLVPFLARAQGKRLPWVVMLGVGTEVVWDGPLPATPAEMIALIKKYGGSHARDNN